MKRKWIALFVLVAFGVVLFRGGMLVGAASSGAGSAADPLITQSYLELRLAEVTSGTASAAYTRVTVERGKTFTAYEGTELVLYGGTGTVAGSSGLVNLSTGELFAAGTTAVKYCVYLSPSDGNGLTAGSTLTLYVKGGYRIG